MQSPESKFARTATASTGNTDSYDSTGAHVGSVVRPLTGRASSRRRSPCFAVRVTSVGAVEAESACADAILHETRDWRDRTRRVATSADRSQSRPRHYAAMDRDLSDFQNQTKHTCELCRTQQTQARSYASERSQRPILPASAEQPSRATFPCFPCRRSWGRAARLTPAQRNVLLARGAQRADRRVARRFECTPDARVRWREPARAVRAPR